MIVPRHLVFISLGESSDGIRGLPGTTPKRARCDTEGGDFLA